MITRIRVGGDDGLAVWSLLVMLCILHFILHLFLQLIQQLLSLLALCLNVLYLLVIILLIGLDQVLLVLKIFFELFVGDNLLVMVYLQLPELHGGLSEDLEEAVDCCLDAFEALQILLVKCAAKVHADLHDFSADFRYLRCDVVLLFSQRVDVLLVLLDFHLDFLELSVELEELLLILLLFSLALDEILLDKQLILEELHTCLVADFVIDVSLYFLQRVLLVLDFLLGVGDLDHLVDAGPDPIPNPVCINVQLHLFLFGRTGLPLDLHVLLNLQHLDLVLLSPVDDLLSLCILLESVDFFVFLEIGLFHLEKLVCSLFAQLVVLLGLFLPFSMSCNLLGLDFADLGFERLDL